MPDRAHHISAGKVIFVLVLLAIVIGAVGLAGYLPRKQREEAALAAAKEQKTDLPLVTTATVKKAAQDVDILLPGNLSPLTEAAIYARAAGYVRKRTSAKVSFSPKSMLPNSINKSPRPKPLSRRPSSNLPNPAPL
jgi:hypothetical protein